MRQGELAALRWEDLDLDGPRPAVRVRRSADTRTKTVVAATKTGKERTAHQLRERMAAATWDDPGWVFPNTRGKVRRRDSVMRSLKALLEKAGLPTDVRFHDLRHTAGAHALKQGRPIHEGLTRR